MWFIIKINYELNYNFHNLFFIVIRYFLSRLVFSNKVFWAVFRRHGRQTLLKPLFISLDRKLEKCAKTYLEFLSEWQNVINSASKMGSERQSSIFAFSRWLHASIAATLLPCWPIFSVFRHSRLLDFRAIDSHLYCYSR